MQFFLLHFSKTDSGPSNRNPYYVHHAANCFDFSRPFYSQVWVRGLKIEQTPIQRCGVIKSVQKSP
jgi:hypothetical protein